MKHILPLFFLVLTITGCYQKRKTSVDGENRLDSVRYAKGFTVARYGDTCTVVEINDPWNRGQLLQRYILVERALPLPGNLPAGTVVRVPIQQIAVYTAVHAGMIDLLDETDRIVGVCEPQYIEIPSIHEGLRSGRIADLGESSSPNVERMIDIETEIVLASPFQNSNYGAVEKMGLPIVEGADYMESHPLGRTEWLRFFGLLLGKEQLADSLFRATEKRYLDLKALAETADDRPTVFSEKKFGSSWYVPSGESYVAHLFADAGADYLFKELPGTGSTPLAFESVFDRAIHADFWLIKYNQAEDLTYQELRMEYTPYENFDVFKKRRVFGCNTGNVPYYEESPIHPDRVLKDYVAIFHPELLPDYALKYYKAVE